MCTILKNEKKEKKREYDQIFIKIRKINFKLLKKFINSRRSYALLMSSI